MTRKRTRHEMIPNEGKRNTTYGKRLYSLIKKANELSILCGVEVAMVVHKRGGEDNAAVWPSLPIFRERLEKFLDLPRTEREKRMMVHENYMIQSLKAETEDSLKLKKTMELKESQQLMNQCKDLNAFHFNQMNGLNSFAGEMLQKLQKRNDELNSEQLLPLLTPSIPAFSFSGGRLQI